MSNVPTLSEWQALALPTVVRDVWEQRALALGVPSQSVAEGDAAGRSAAQVVCFTLQGGQQGQVVAALDVACVRGVYPAAPLLPLPGAVAGVCGLANVEGQVVAVVDPAALLGLSAGSEYDWFVLAEMPPAGDGTLALVALSVGGPVTVDRLDIPPSPLPLYEGVTGLLSPTEPAVVYGLSVDWIAVQLSGG